MNLRKIFNNDVSSGAFQKIDGETRIVGKWGQIATICCHFDIWIIKPDLEPVSPRKLSFIQKKFPVEGMLTVLDGEAYTQTRDESLVRKILSLLGIKRKRQLSPKTIKQLTERLAQCRGVVA